MITIFGVEYEEVEGTEFTAPSGKKMVRHENEKYKVIQQGTGLLFDMADDLYDSDRQYGLTDVWRDDVEHTEETAEETTAIDTEEVEEDAAEDITIEDKYVS